MLFSCSEEADKHSELNDFTAIDENQFTPFSLTPYGINAEIMLPDSADVFGIPQDWIVEHELDGFEWLIRLPNEFEILIEDWGQENGLAHYEDELSNMKNSSYFLLEKSDSFLAYTEKTSTNEKRKEVQHLFQQTTIDNINYVFRTTQNGCAEQIAPYISTSLKRIK